MKTNGHYIYTTSKEFNAKKQQFLIWKIVMFKKIRNNLSSVWMDNVNSIFQKRTFNKFTTNRVKF